MKNFKTILDVRSIGEYAEGRVESSINIPLDQIQERLDEIKSLAQPIVLCCQSGGRSGVATEFLTKEGVNCFNGGGWEQVDQAIENGELCLEN
ncbi:MAG: rhodanese-like domain-containing protein [Flavobacteriaceae bacterium]|nr:rhodanese-like domain-containing protein [Flavobacteriaceae bacterium]